MKKLDGRARNAIRWLEKQFQHGNNIFTYLTPYIFDSIYLPLTNCLNVSQDILT